MNLSPIFVELDFIHQLIDQVDAAAVAGKNVLAGAGVGKLADIKAGAGIAHHDEHAVRFVAGHIAFDNLGGIRVRAVYDRISFWESKLQAVCGESEEEEESDIGGLGVRFSGLVLRLPDS